MPTVKALAAQSASAELSAFEYDLPDTLGPTEVDIAVTHCGICHSDLAMRNNHWEMSSYPLVPGHEVAGTIKAKGEHVTHLNVGDTVGLGWFSNSCMTCDTCMGGDHNLCASNEHTIVGRHGGFASQVRCDAAWATPIPAAIDPAVAGPLFCGGITVFNPIVQQNVKPTDRVGVIGIGGLGHMALGFLNKWGCEVTAFTSSDAKSEEAMQMGAHKVVNNRSEKALADVVGQYDFILNTVMADLDWTPYIHALGPKGVLHHVGTPPTVSAATFDLIMGQKSIAGSPLGSPATTRQMLDFCARHDLKPVTETFKMSQANDAFEHLESGKARYRIVLEQDLG